MADFSFVSDGSSDEGAVEELLNQAMDDSVLKQIAALNLSSFSSDSVLPTQLETRFRSLKSFPSTNAPKASNLPTNKNSSSSSSSSGFCSKSNLPSHKPLSPKSKNNLLSDDEDDNLFEKKSFESKSASGSGSSRSTAGEKPDPNGKRVSNSKARSGSFNKRRGSNSRARSEYFLSPSVSSGSGSSPSKARSGEEAGGYEKKDLNPEARSGSFLSSPDCSNSDSPSPPKKTGCFWCSPKRVSEKKSKGDRELGFDDYWRRNNKEILADLSVFSAKKQQKMLKMAMKEEQKFNREAEKIVKWAKQASARMNVSDIEDELSDCENHK